MAELVTLEALRRKRLSRQATTEPGGSYAEGQLRREMSKTMAKAEVATIIYQALKEAEEDGVAAEYVAPLILETVSRALFDLSLPAMIVAFIKLGHEVGVDLPPPSQALTDLAARAGKVGR